MHRAENRAGHPLGVLRHEEPRKIGAGRGRGERDAEGETTRLALAARWGDGPGALPDGLADKAVAALQAPCAWAFALAPNANRRVAPMARDRRRPARFRAPASAPPYAASGISP